MQCSVLFSVVYGLALITAISSIHAEDLKKYTEPRDAIAAAKQGDRLIAFVLIEGFEDASKKVEKALEEAVAKQRGDFFVLGVCQHRNLSHRAMFERRFKKDISKAPVAVICDADGKEVTGCYGDDPKVYVNMLRFARIKTGKFVNKREENKLKEQMAEDDEAIGGNIFGLTRAMIKPKQELLSPSKTWTYKEGKTIQAALLKANGPKGIFVTEDGNEIEIDFNELSDVDISYLKQLLSQ